MISEDDIPDFANPTVRGEQVAIVGPKPQNYTGVGYEDGEIIVMYPDGEAGCVNLADIKEGPNE